MRTRAALLLVSLAGCLEVQQQECATDGDCDGGPCLQGVCGLPPECRVDLSSCEPTSCETVTNDCGAPVPCADACVASEPGASCDGATCCRPRCAEALCGERRCDFDCVASCGFWQAVPQPPPGPVARAYASLAWDGTRLVLFGGHTGGDVGEGALDDTWAFDPVAERWEPLAVDPRPPARSAAILARVPGSSALLLYGGTSGTEALGDLWRFEDGTWRPLAPAGDAPPPRHGAAGAFLPDGSLLVHGGGLARTGSDAQPAYDDTWRWDPNGGPDGAWAQVATGPPRQWAVVVSDGERLVVHGGDSSPHHLQAGTFAWTGDGWTELRVDGPTARIQHGAATLPGGRGFALFGGDDGTSSNSEETWLFLRDGPRFVHLDRDGGPSSRDGAALASAEGHGVFLFGGEPSQQLSDALFRLAILE